MLSYLDYFTPMTQGLLENPHSFRETKNEYEFEMYAFATSPRHGYAIVIGADGGRVADLSEIVKEEFGAKLRGWLVLREYQDDNEPVIASPDISQLKFVTYYDNKTPVWVVKIAPHTGSRLLDNLKSPDTD